MLTCSSSVSVPKGQNVIDYNLRYSASLIEFLRSICQCKLEVELSIAQNVVWWKKSWELAFGMLHDRHDEAFRISQHDVDGNNS